MEKLVAVFETWRWHYYFKKWKNNVRLFSFYSNLASKRSYVSPEQSSLKPAGGWRGKFERNHYMFDRMNHQCQELKGLTYPRSNQVWSPWVAGGANTNALKVNCPKQQKTHINDRAKGQIILECLFDVFQFSKKTSEKFDKFLPKNLKSGQIIKKQHHIVSFIH